MARHILSILLENNSGTLSRVVGLFSARGYNIETITAAPTENPSISRMTISTSAGPAQVEQITKHLNRLVEVIKVVDLLDNDYVERELMLVKVRAIGRERDEMLRISEIFRGRVVDVTDKSYTIEVTGDSSKLDAFLKAIDKTAILETVRTGASGIGRGERILKV
ncbi:MAG: acetolactate synthase small subunit [Duodenibacillus sp.]|nr:acetolactate synthase small subunit [Duodenibacillus sp.]HBC69906.1 acetolactate synthase small subunit [Sutterella sp.]